MPSREQIVALGNTIPAFRSCFSVIAAASPTASAVFDQVTASIAAMIDPIDQIAALVAMARDLQTAGADLASDWMDVGRAVALLPATTASPALNRAAGLARCGSAFLQAACWQEAAICAVQNVPRLRSDAQALRAALVAGVEPVLDRVSELCGSDAYHALKSTADIAVRGIDDEIVTIAPLAKITTPRRLPATVAAWLLYDDPNKAADIVARAGVSTPLLMPATFLAEAPTAL